MLRCSNCDGGVVWLPKRTTSGARVWESKSCYRCKGVGEVARYEVVEVFRSTCEPEVVERHDDLLAAFEAKASRISARVALGQPADGRAGYVCLVWDGDDGERGELDELTDVGCTRCGWNRDEHDEDECPDPDWTDALYAQRSAA